MTWNPNATVTIGGVDFTGSTLNGVSINYGRPTIWDQPRSSYAQISILNSTNTNYNFEINDPVVVTVEDSDGTIITVFTGSLTDLSNEIASSGTVATVATQTITAVGPFAAMSRILVGQTNYPKEYDDVRINRIFTEAAVTVDVVDTPGVYELQERPANTTDAYSLSSYYAGMCFGYIYETKTGAVGYANESRRNIELENNGYFNINDSYINWRGINSRKSISDIVNRVVLFYKNNQTKISEDTHSIANYGLFEARINTELEDNDQAQNIADRYASLRSIPQTNFSNFNINLDNPNILAADLDKLINIEMGTPIQIDNLPNAISHVTYQGFVEGWQLIIDRNQALLNIISSDSTYSVVPIRWQDIDLTTIWTDIDPTATTSTKTNLVTNPTFEPINLYSLGYAPMRTAAATADRLVIADSTILDITGDIDLRAKISVDDWTPSATNLFISKRSTNNLSYTLQINATGNLVIIWSADGSTVLSATSTVATGITDGTIKWVRATLDVNNGAGGRDIKFYTSDNGITWTQLGSTVTQAGTTSIFSGSADLQIGYNSASGVGFNGKFYAAEIRNGIDGTVVFYTDISGDFKPTNGFTYTAYSGQTVTCYPTLYAWSPNTGTTLSKSTDTSYSGLGSMKVTVSTAGAGRGPFTTTNFRIPVTAGTSYTFSCYMKDVDTNVQWRNVIQWYNAITGGSLISSNTGTSTTISKTGWTRVIVTGIAPVGATYATLFPQNSTSAALNTFIYMDAFQFETGSTDSSYFDGYTSDIPDKEYPSLAWTGTAQESTSTAIAYWGTKPTTTWDNVDTVGLP